MPVEWFLSAAALLAHLWPEAPGIAPDMVAWEVARMILLCLGTGAGLWLIWMGVKGEWAELKK